MYARDRVGAKERHDNYRRLDGNVYKDSGKKTRVRELRQRAILKLWPVFSSSFFSFSFEPSGT